MDSTFSGQSSVSSQSSHGFVNCPLAANHIAEHLSLDKDLCPLFDTTLEKFGGDKFQRKLARLLHGYAEALRTTANSPTQRKAATFVQQERKSIADRVRWGVNQGQTTQRQEMDYLA